MPGNVSTVSWLTCSSFFFLHNSPGNSVICFFLFWLFLNFPFRGNSHTRRGNKTRLNVNIRRSAQIRTQYYKKTHRVITIDGQSDAVFFLSTLCAASRACVKFDSAHREWKELNMNQQKSSFATSEAGRTFCCASERRREIISKSSKKKDTVTVFRRDLTIELWLRLFIRKMGLLFAKLMTVFGDRGKDLKSYCF